MYTDDRGLTWVTERFIRCGCTNDDVATAANTRRSQDEHYASALYQQLLARAGSPAEIAAVTDRLTYLAPRSRVVAGFATSPEWIGRVIDAYYRDTFGRGVDPSGLQAWTAAYLRGTAPATIAASLLGSDEFFTRSGGRNRSWVEALYRHVFDRAPDTAGWSHWTEVADAGVSRPAIAIALYQSQESRARRVIELYEQLLGRAPDATGLAGWSGQLANGQDIQLASSLAQSDEYYLRAQAVG